MKTILHITSSARADSSYSTNLGKEIIDRIRKKYGSISVITWDLVDTPPPLYTHEMVQGFYTPVDTPDYCSIKSLAYANDLIERINAADMLVISTPMHNFGISAHLKAWIDQLVRFGVTYTYDGTGNRVGLIADKDVYLAIASGGTQSSSPVQDYIADYLTAVFRTYVGITKIQTYRIEGTAFPNFSPDYNAILADFPH
ncbi:MULTISPECIES: FMN-dependent NADH-azoreductase [Sphingobacterium]|uniref:FMN dependent NADH:quinone oxidoreductase n=1 Tax=Sphingobacterium siyangense TaxID=459529 RepID=A0A562N0X2_9SPHI|nr:MULTISPECIES: NAD(P)H-dependent oxidoreductase [Sphingobacterium]TWI25784.1 FMN-dependent NADH-azoreductase [Sphingobacterium siyangense]